MNGDDAVVSFLYHLPDGCEPLEIAGRGCRAAEKQQRMPARCVAPADLPERRCDTG